MQDFSYHFVCINSSFLTINCKFAFPMFFFSIIRFTSSQYERKICCVVFPMFPLHSIFKSGFNILIIKSNIKICHCWGFVLYKYRVVKTSWKRSGRKPMVWIPMNLTRRRSSNYMVRSPSLSVLNTVDYSTSWLWHLFALTDTNGDGYFDEQELEALFTKEVPLNNLSI